MKWQQGDVLIRKINEIPSEADEIKGSIIQQSEHPHFVIGAKVRKLNEKTFFIVDAGGATLQHRKEGGHQSIQLTPGNYSVSQVMERNMFSGLKAPVQD